MPESEPLSTLKATALYVGALLGPSALLLPGLAVSIAGPASILAWSGLLVVSAMLAATFTALGVQFPTATGVAGYAAAGLGEAAGRAVRRSFVLAVVVGAPVVCVIGGGYVAELLDRGSGTGLAVAAALLVVVVALTLGGARVSSGLQLALVGVLLAVIVVAVVVAAPSAHRANWTPFAPHGRGALGSAASVLMLSFIGWEAIAPLTPRLRDPRRQLPRICAMALGVTSVVYLALAAATIGVLGGDARTTVPLSLLLQAAIGSVGSVAAAVAAIALTLAATNAYISGAAAMLAVGQGSGGRTAQPWLLQVAIGVTGLAIIGAFAIGLTDLRGLVALPTALFVVVYLGCTGAATRLLDGPRRIVAGTACVCVAVVLGCSGWSALAALAFAGVGSLPPASRSSRSSRRSASSGLPVGQAGEDELAEPLRAAGLKALGLARRTEQEP